MTDHRLYGWILLLSISGSLGCGLTHPTGEIHQFEPFFVQKSDLASDPEVTVTYLGASTLLFDDGKTSFLVDAYLSRLALKELVFRRVQTDTAKVNSVLLQAQTRDLDAILITHTHFDHVLDAGYIARTTGAKVFGSASARQICLGSGVPDERIHVIEDGYRLSLGQFDILFVSVVHSPMSIFMDDLGRTIDAPISPPKHIVHYREGGSFHLLIRHNGHSLYVNPSASDVDQIPDSIRAEVVFLGMGLMRRPTQEFRFRHYQHSVAKLEPCLVVPIHWDNYCLPDARTLDLIPASISPTSNWFDEVMSWTLQDGIEFVIVPGGQSIGLFARTP